MILNSTSDQSMTTTDTTSESPTVYCRNGDVARILLNRPDNLNAVTSELYAGIRDGLSRAEAEGALAVIIEGVGQAFCVGADMENHADTERTIKERRDYVWQAQDTCKTMQTHSQPIIAQVHGYAIGAGAELALSADFILMAEDAEIRFPEVGIGTFVGGGITYTLVQRVGSARAKELILSTACLSGEDAAEEGIVTAAYPESELDSATADLAGDLAGNAPIPMSLAKSQFARVGTATREDMLTAEAEALQACMSTDDWQEGVDAFAENREPEFRGR